MGSNFDDFLKEEGIPEEAQAVAVKRLVKLGGTEKKSKRRC